MRNLIKSEISGKIAHKKMWGKRWGKSVIDKQKSLVNQGFFLLI